MMTINKEGYPTLGIVFALFLVVNAGLLFVDLNTAVRVAILTASILLFVFFLNFFRDPKRIPLRDESLFISPADGEIVVIEEVYEPEYFQEKRLQVSIFMSAWNVHKNWIPVSGKIAYFKYHPGKYLLARNPKSSELNERTSVVVDNGQHQILLRQIAGIMARRVVAYVSTGQQVEQGEALGFIKFGSRVDMFFPAGTPINVRPGDKVTGSQTVIAQLK